MSFSGLDGYAARTAPYISDVLICCWARRLVSLPKHQDCHGAACREAFDALTDASAVLLKHGDYHAHTDTRERMQQRIAEGSAARDGRSSARNLQPAPQQAAESAPDAESSDSMEEVSTV